MTRVWSKTMWDEAQALLKQNKPRDEIAARCGVTVTQLYFKIYNEKLAVRSNHVSEGPIVSIRLASEREARAAAAALRTRTQEFFGDPPPGYSALDMKRKGIAT